MRRFGYDAVAIKVDALSGTAKNARQIRDAVMAMDGGSGAARVVLIGYSKGAPDVLDAIVNHPEIRPRVAAVVSAAGAIGGSPLANDATQYQAEMLQHFPGAACDPGDGGAVESLRPATRRAWLAQHPLPADVRYYSLVTFPQPERISSILTGSYDRLARIDSRNDSQMIFYDQVIPGSSARRLRQCRPLGARGADRAPARNDRLAVRHAERLSARSADRGALALHRGRPCQRAEVIRGSQAQIARSSPREPAPDAAYLGSTPTATASV